MIRNDNPTASQIPPNQSQKFSVVITRVSLVAARALFFADRREQNYGTARWPILLSRPGYC
jgi:hypothetical protein